LRRNFRERKALCGGFGTTRAENFLENKKSKKPFKNGLELLPLVLSTLYGPIKDAILSFQHRKHYRIWGFKFSGFFFSPSIGVIIVCDDGRLSPLSEHQKSGHKCCPLDLRASIRIWLTSSAVCIWPPSYLTDNERNGQFLACRELPFCIVVVVVAVVHVPITNEHMWEHEFNRNSRF
jgi:hypothetical protein